MTLQARITALTQSIGTDIKALTTNQGSLPALATTNKTSLVLALNELKGILDGLGSPIDDLQVASTTKTYSVNKIIAIIAQAKADILGGASSAYDTLLEIQTILQGDGSNISNLLTAVANRVRFDAAQTLTVPQITQACANIGLGEPDTDLVAIYNTAKA
jgi:hypothetical protein